MVLDAGGQLADHIALADTIAKKGSGRTVPIHPLVRAALLRLRKEQGSEGFIINSERADGMRPGSIVNWSKPFSAALALSAAPLIPGDALLSRWRIVRSRG